MASLGPPGRESSFTPRKSKAKPSLPKVKLIFLPKVLELLQLIDWQKSDFRHDNRSVFLCGGPIDEAAYTPSSVREAILRSLPDRNVLDDARIILAEKAVQEISGSSFSNLLTLEEFIAAIVDGVILVVESPGSICELGSFVKAPEIRNKLIVLISNINENTKSFIRLGALDYFRDQRDGDAEIHPFHWNLIPGGVQVEDYVVSALLAGIQSSVRRLRRSGKLDLSSLGDRMYLTLSLCHLLRGARHSELKTCYSAIGLGDKKLEIPLQLSALEICGLIKPVSHGKGLKYFIPLVTILPMKIAFLDGVPDKDRDTLRWVGQIADLIKAKEPSRLKIFQEHQNAL